MKERDIKPVIIGVGESDQIGIVPGKVPLDHAVEAALSAMSDAGLEKGAIDGIYTTQCASMYEVLSATHLAGYMGMAVDFANWVPYGGVATNSILGLAADAIAQGHCTTMLIASGDTLRSGLGRGAVTKIAENADSDFEQIYQPTIVAQYAFATRRHSFEFGTTPEQFAEVPVAARAHAALNPRAQMRDLITVEDVLASKPIASPLHLLECALISDGGAALIMTSESRADALGCRNPVHVLGYSHVPGQMAVTEAPSFTQMATTRAAELAYSMSGLSASEVDVCFPYDNFGPMVVMALEDLGFCAKGEGGAFVEDGRIGPGGALPVNTHGGLLSYAHPGRPLFSLIEAVRQLRGEAGAAQTPDARVALVHGLSGVFSSASVTLLAR